MARPFATSSDKTSPMSPQSGPSTPISYQANVNRQKTKKWTDAKPVDYGGDDWGDDGYGEYDEPPAPAPKTTGLRQQGQTLQSPPPHSDSHADSSNTKRYGDFAPVPPANRGRANSFDNDDEHRNFSSSATPISPNAPATRFSQITGTPSVRNPSEGPPALSISTQALPSGLRKPSQVISPVAESPRPEIAQPTRTVTGRSGSITSPVSDARASSDYHAQRNYSPSALPAPLATRGSPAPQSPADAPSTRFPGRKSSLSQSTGPSLAEINRQPHDAESSTTRKSGGPSPSMATNPESPSVSTGKSLPFIRPADIYRRAEEERRQSLESGGRPSMDSIVGARPNDTLTSPSKSRLVEKSSSDSLGAQRRVSVDADHTSNQARHQSQSLEPVKERKSEYGIEAFNIAGHAPNPEPTPGDEAPNPRISKDVEPNVERSHRQSTSPKLPNVNRMSGFGMDMFSSSPANAPVIEDREATPTTSSKPPIEDPTGDTTQLPRQSSVGFRSVVNQAFDRGDESPLPPTPASQASSSNVQRTDSTSTGTAGISPIMSRVPSNSVQNRDFAAPSVLEVVDETSPIAGKNFHEQATSEAAVTGFKPGHRRDISTPSPGNSPARTPDVAKTEAFLHGQQAALSSTPLDENKKPDNESLQPLRPGASSSLSFRPILPGGWTSYATSARTASPQPDAASDVDRFEENAPHRHSEELDLTPTATRSSLTKSPSSEKAIEERQNADESVTSLVPKSPEGARSKNSFDSTIHPGLLPKLEQAPPETQLRPDVVDSSAPIRSPATMLKDTDRVDSTEANASSVPTPFVPHVQTSGTDPLFKGESKTNEQDPQDSSIDDDRNEENDKLQEEIVSRLSPQPTDRYDSSMLSAQPSNATTQSRESTYLPTEYGDYWASTSPDPADAPSPTAIASKTAGNPENTFASRSPVEDPVHSQPDTPIAPLIIHKSGETSVEPQGPPLKPRFSWEKSMEDEYVAQEPLSQEHSNDTRDDQNQTHELEAGVVEHPGLIVSSQAFHGQRSSAGPEHTVHRTESLTSTGGALDHHVDTDSSIPRGITTVPGETGAVNSDSKTQGGVERQMSLAQEKEMLVSSYPVSPIPENEHTSTPQTYVSPPADRTSFPSDTSTVSPTNSSAPPQNSHATTRLMAFREIAALKSPHQRIETFDDTRHRFAAMESGLSDWMATLRAQHPEHTDVTRSYVGASDVGLHASSTKPKFAKPMAGSNAPLQQPYYQQYLNASSPTSPSSPTSKPPPSMPSSYQQQGFSPAGGSKMTSHQVQAKGKEFLHTAGVFGGKAGKAGKGLLAKGKNRLRGSGGGDKTTPSSTPKTERRSSWGLPLALARSSGRASSSSRRSKEETPNSIPQPQRAATIGSFQSLPTQSPHRTSESIDMVRRLDPSLPIINTPLSTNEPISSVRELRDPDQSTPDTTCSRNTTGNVVETENGDKIGSPSHVTTNTPSRDPSLVSSAVNEQDPMYKNQQTQESYPFPAQPITEPHILSESSEPPPKSICSNSEDGQFYDASEEHLALKSDWVLVDPEDKTKKEEYAARDETEVSEVSDIDDASPSMLNRPRGNSYVPLQPHQGIDGAIPTSTFNIPTQQSLDHSGSSRSAAASAQQATSASSLPLVASQSGREEQNDDPNFLPPIRRTSTFGFNFNSREAKQRQLAEASDEVPNVPVSHFGHAVGDQQPWTGHTESNPSRISTVVEGHNSTSNPIKPQIHPQYSPRKDTWQPAHQRNASQFSFEQESEPQHQSHDKAAEHTPSAPTQFYEQSSKDSKFQQRSHVSDSHVDAQRSDDLSVERFNTRISQDSWRPNVSSPSHTAVQQPESSSMSSRMPWEPQRSRGSSGSNQNPYQFSEGQFPSRPQWTPQQSKTFEQPPSSAQRYPELFRTEQQTPESFSKETGDLPPEYYQAPIPREAAFLPRQQTNEYQLPGVGPPVEEPRNTARRNSFMKEIGGRIYRATSRERRSSVSRDRERSRERGTRDHENDSDDCSMTSEDGLERNNRRSSFFRNLGRSSTGALNPPQSRESMVAHHPGSRTDLLMTPQPSPIVAEQRKRSFFGSNSAEPSKPSPKKLSRSSTSGMSDAGEKKKRFSGLSGLFGKSSSSRLSLQGSPQTTRELSYKDRQPLESPQFQSQTASRHQAPPLAPAQDRRASSQGPRAVLNRMTSSMSPSSTPTREKEKERVSQGDNKSRPRRPSTSGLFNGLIGRKSDKSEGKSDDSRSQGSSQPLAPQYVPPARTYTDLQNVEPWTQRPPQPFVPPPAHRMVQSLERSNMRSEPTERGRQVEKELEPQYDSVPIPGGYSLVRGQGAMVVPSEYDPRGLGQKPGEPRFMPRDTHYQQDRSHQHIGNQEQYQQSHSIQPDQSFEPRADVQPKNKRQHPNLSAIETYQNHQNRSEPNPLSQEDVLARSPARSPEGQQRPYKLSLPEDDVQRNYPMNSTAGLDAQRHDAPLSSNLDQASKPKLDKIQRLQGTPVLRHPESPAGYPLPEDSAFTPVDATADDLPPPPPPKWPAHLDAQLGHSSQSRNQDQPLHPLYLDHQGLDRSNTRLTAVSAISGISDPRRRSGGSSGGLAVPGRNESLEGDRHVSSPSPTPPTPRSSTGSPHRKVSPALDSHEGEIKKTTIERQSSPDLYNASSMFPKGSNKASTNGSNENRHSSSEHDKENRKLAELHTNEKELEEYRKRRKRSAEEKIFYDAQSGQRHLSPGSYDDDGDEPTMSATSYPGQEWNPYGVGYEED